MDAAQNHKLTSKAEPVKCHLVEFADSSVNFLLFVWIDDFSEGRYTIQNDILFEIWDEFKKEGIEIPFPQRDLHIKNLDALASGNDGEKQQKPQQPQSKRPKRKVGAKVTSNTKKDKKKLH